MRDWTDEWDVTGQTIWTHVKRMMLTIWIHIKHLILPAAIVFSVAALAVIALNGCGTVSIKPVSFPPQELKIKVDGGTVEKDKEEIAKSMVISNPYLEFSRACRVNGDQAFITITSISSYDSTELWRDFKLIKIKGIKEVIIYLNSPGGAAFQGMSITDEMRVLKELGIKITVEGRGLIASAAIPVFLMADKRIATKSTIFLIHPAALSKWGFFTETLSDLQSQAKLITMLQESYAESVSAGSNLSKERVLEMMKQDHWFTAQEAKEFGFIDEIQ